MPLAPSDHPDDDRVVVTEVAVHLGQLASQRIVDRRQLERAWTEMRICDDAVLGSLPHGERQRYQSVLDRPHRQVRPNRGWINRPGIGTDAAHLRVALHRRLIVLRSR